MTFDQIIVFHQVVELGSFKAAASHLHKTQPALSAAIKKLEEELDCQLFDRSGYRPTLTTHGQVFYEKSKKVLLEFESLEGLKSSFSKHEEPVIRLSIDGISPLPHLLRLIHQFEAKFIHTKLDLSMEILSGTEDKLIRNESLIGLTHFVSRKDLFDMVPVSKVKMVPVINSEVFKEKKIKSEVDLQKIKQIVLSEKNPQSSNQSFGLLSDGMKWYVNDAQFKHEIILSGLGWGHIPYHSIERELKEKKLTILKLETIYPKELDIFLIKLKKKSLGPVATKLWDELSLGAK